MFILFFIIPSTIFLMMLFTLAISFTIKDDGKIIIKTGSLYFKIRKLSRYPLACFTAIVGKTMSTPQDRDEIKNYFKRISYDANAGAELDSNLCSLFWNTLLGFFVLLPLVLVASVTALGLAIGVLPVIGGYFIGKYFWTGIKILFSCILGCMEIIAWIFSKIFSITSKPNFKTDKEILKKFLKILKKWEKNYISPRENYQYYLDSLNLNKVKGKTNIWDFISQTSLGEKLWNFIYQETGIINDCLQGFRSKEYSKKELQQVFKCIEKYGLLDVMRQRMKEYSKKEKKKSKRKDFFKKYWPNFQLTKKWELFKNIYNKHLCPRVEIE